MAFGPARPPMTEDVAGVIAKDIKSTEGKGATSEVPLAFQTGAGHKAVDPAVLRQSRKQILIFGGIALALLFGIWSLT